MNKNTTARQGTLAFNSRTVALCMRLKREGYFLKCIRQYKLMGLEHIRLFLGDYDLFRVICPKFGDITFPEVPQLHRLVGIWNRDFAPKPRSTALVLKGFSDGSQYSRPSILNDPLFKALTISTLLRTTLDRAADHAACSMSSGMLNQREPVSKHSEGSNMVLCSGSPLSPISVTNSLSFPHDLLYQRFVGKKREFFPAENDFNSALTTKHPMLHCTWE